MYLGENNFRNMRTGAEGKIDDEKAREVFRVNLEMTQMVEENPLICELVKRCNLKVDIQTLKNGIEGNSKT